MLAALSFILMTTLITPTLALNTRQTPRATINTITITSPGNRTYTNTTGLPKDIPLVFEITDIGLGKQGNITKTKYSLDGQTNITISGSTTIHILSFGHHRVIIYAFDALGNAYASNTVHFTVSIVGDLDGDGEVKISDIVLAIAAFDSAKGDPDWNPEADVAPVFGRVDIYDLITIAADYGDTITW